MAAPHNPQSARTVAGNAAGVYNRAMAGETDNALDGLRR